jgi:hypothetical protein
MVLAWQRKRKPKSPRMPDEWALTGRAVFSTSERRIFRLLRETLASHVILAKLPMVRFCQPIDFGRTRYWYDLLGSNYVSFAICAPNGRVLAAIDIDKDRSSEENPQLRRSMKIKRAVLRSCRIRYLRIPAGSVLTESEIMILLSPTKGFFEENPLDNGSEDSTLETRSMTQQSRGPSATSEATAKLTRARESLASTVASRRAQRNVLWQESSLFQDSFFALDSRLDDNAADDTGTTALAKVTQAPPRAAQSAPKLDTVPEPELPAAPAPSTESQPAKPSLESKPARPEGNKKRSRASRNGRRRPPVVKVTLEDTVPSERLNTVVQLDTEEARYAAGQS